MTRFWLTLLLVFTVLASVGEAQKKAKIESDKLTADTWAFFASKLVIPNQAPEDSDWSELLARLGWVLMRQPLPEEARRKTYARANSSEKFGWADKPDEKRILSVIISKLDESNRASGTLEARIYKLEEEIRAIKKEP